MNPIYEEYQFGAFSDNFAVSMPTKSGYRIIDAAAEVCGKLLQLGFLTRGGITIGKLHHDDNVIFGPALVDAVKLEKEAIYPRLIFSPELIDHFEALPSLCEVEPVIVDHLGREIANLFMPLAVPLNHRQIYEISTIEKIIEEEIQRHVQSRSDKLAEKWRYMRDVLPLMLNNIAKMAR